MSETREAIRQKLAQHAVERGALKFGKFTLKSGRESPYFFDSSILADGQGLSLLGAAYASTLAADAPNFDVLYGPPYKGIPLAAITGAALSDRYGITRRVTYSRKEKKDHGEGGLLVGGDFVGKKVLIADDVITAGTALIEASKFIKKHGDGRTKIVGAIVVLDRQERSDGSTLSAVQSIEQTLGFKVLSVFTFDYLIKEVERGTGPLAVAAKSSLRAMRDYRIQYGV